MNRVLGFFWTVVLARALGLEGFGEYTYLVALVTLTSAFAEGGFTSIVSRDVARDPAQLQEMVPTAMGLTVIFNIAAALITVAIALIDTPSRARFLHAGLVALYLPSNGIFNVISAVFRGRDRFLYDSVFNIVQFVAFAVLSGVALLLGWGVTGVIAAFVVRQYLTAGASMILCERRIGRVPIALRRPALRYLLREGLPLMLSGAAAQVYIRVDIIILSLAAGTTAVAIYSIASRFVDTLTTAASALGFASLPLLATLFRADPDHARQFIRRISWRVLLFSAIGSAVGIAVSPALIRSLYGAPFAAAGHVLQILLLTIPIYAVSQLLSTVVVVEGRQKALVGVYGGATLLSIVLNALLAPQLNYYGSALAGVATATSVGVALLFVTRRLKGEETGHA